MFFLFRVILFSSLFLHDDTLAAIPLRPLQPLHSTSTFEIPFYPRKLEIEFTQQSPAWNIIWSCLTSFYVCQWFFVHPPNILGPSESHNMSLTRLKIMACLFIAPELVIVWAGRQWFAASRTSAISHFSARYFPTFFRCTRGKRRKLRKVHQKRNSIAAKHEGGFDFTIKYKMPTNFGISGRAWTITHDFLASMGGFMLYGLGDGNMIKTLDMDTLEQLYKEDTKDRIIEWPSIKKKEIEDGSKGDFPSKVIAVLQTAWFTAQCIMIFRGVFKISQGLLD